MRTQNCITASSVSLPAYLLLRKKPRMIVHSVFKKVINLLAESEEIISIMPAQFGKFPYGVNCYTLPDDLRKIIQIGQPINIERHQTLCINDQRFCINYSRSEVWVPRVRFPQPSSTRRFETTTILWYQQFIQQHASGYGLTILGNYLWAILVGRDPGHQDQLMERAIAGIWIVMEGIQSGDANQIIHGGRKLVGLGPGLTPSGDDVLVSLLLCACLTAPEKISTEIKKALKHLSDFSQNRTTDFSSFQYQIASKGYVSEPYRDVIESFFINQEKELLHEKAMRIISYGESSGMEILIGMLLGIALSAAFQYPSLSESLYPFHQFEKEAF